MSEHDKTEFLVVDTSAFVENVHLQDLGKRIVTVQGVINEIRNHRQLRNLAVLPYTLEIIDPMPGDVKFVTEFSKKTGDYTSLSVTDLQVMALAYRLERENLGTDHLRKEPVRNRISVSGPSDSSSLNTPGFYLPCEKVLKPTDSETSLSSGSCERTEYTPSDKAMACGTVSEETLAGVENLSSAISTECVSETCEEICAVQEAPSLESKEVSESEDEESVSTIQETCDEEEGGWISPTNIAQAVETLSEVGVTCPIVVACITSDFSIQNVLRQIGLNVLSMKGRMIKEIRTFILRCYACFKTTSIMSKKFCPHCGNKTLKRVEVRVQEDGSQEIILSSKKRITGRGKRFSLPKPQGGKHANNPILCEDQRTPHQHASRAAQTRTDPFDPDYTSGFSPFATRDITSRSASLRITRTEIKNWMKQNPNAAGPRKKK